MTDGNKCYLQDVNDIQVEAEVKLNSSSSTTASEEIGENRMTTTILPDVPTDDDTDRMSLTPVTNVPLLPSIRYQVTAVTETI